MTSSPKAIEYELVRGPQDGAKVQKVYPAFPMPKAIYVGKVWQGDGFASWSTKWSLRFPCRYELDGNKFFFVGT